MLRDIRYEILSGARRRKSRGVNHPYIAPLRKLPLFAPPLPKDRIASRCSRGFTPSCLVQAMCRLQRHELEGSWKVISRDPLPGYPVNINMGGSMLGLGIGCGSKKHMR